MPPLKKRLNSGKPFEKGFNQYNWSEEVEKRADKRQIEEGTEGVTDVEVRKRRRFEDRQFERLVRKASSQVKKLQSKVNRRESKIEELQQTNQQLRNQMMDTNVGVALKDVFSFSDRDVSGFSRCIC